jgi:ketosteroid isomerase-like protein
MDVRSGIRRAATLLLFSATVAGSSGFGQEAIDTTALQSLVGAERAFAQTSAELGMRAAFLDFLSDDGILFRPAPVNGKKVTSEEPDPQATLSWEPDFADVALSGDIGYTTGPWSFTDRSGKQQPPIFGHYVTIWKRFPQGDWRVAVDLGVPHPEQPAGHLSLAQGVLVSSRLAKKGQTSDNGNERLALLSVEKRFSDASAARGAHAAYLEVADAGVRLYRRGRSPFIGRDSMKTAIGLTPGILTWSTDSAVVSKAADLGYTYGRYHVAAHLRAGDVPQEGYYVRIWKKNEADLWKLVLDIFLPEPHKT